MGTEIVHETINKPKAALDGVLIPILQLMRKLKTLRQTCDIYKGRGRWPPPRPGRESEVPAHSLIHRVGGKKLSHSPPTSKSGFEKGEVAPIGCPGFK
ncbi:ORF4 [Giant panda anellovirus]|uniref:ORF4 n=1 Tax=Giant panda anellovirus TaxID=2016460 RepID=A0A220IGM5_9VIRU|nr:ORF4 [Giant panda anellovirus]ASH99135.1 ORF4 [Giant panda anellovirus]